jgi:glycosyltransferase involved in cell wall biosynthesis
VRHETDVELGVVMAARNEATTVARALQALNSQTLAPSVVAVVDDGSTDGTSERLAVEKPRLSFELEVVRTAYHERSYVGRPELARVLNEGLRVLKERRPPLDYVMKLDGDHILPRDYAERVIGRMRADPRLAVASGSIAGERFAEASPRGSGMVVRAGFWTDANGLKFPLEYGWESWLYLKAQAMGYRTRSFTDIPTRVARPTSVTKGAPYGRGMYALGYFWPYALGRCLLVAARSPSGSLQMLRGYVDHRGVSRLDIGGWVGQAQRRALLKKGVQVVVHFGKR